MLDGFQMGPNLVRGFTPPTASVARHHLSQLRRALRALGGTKYWGASFELQMPFGSPLR